MSNDRFTDEEIPPPDFLTPGIRCALEMALVGILVGLVGLPAQNPLYLGIVGLLALLSMVVVLFWCLNRQMEAWIHRARGDPTLDGSRIE